MTLNSATFTKINFSCLETVHDRFILQGKNVKDPIRSLDTNDIVSVANERDEEMIPMHGQL